MRGEWKDPRLDKTTVAEWSERWLRTKANIKPKTIVGYESNLRDHVLTTFVFFFKQKAAYKVYQCDWSSDVCSSNLLNPRMGLSPLPPRHRTLSPTPYPAPPKRPPGCSFANRRSS